MFKRGSRGQAPGGTGYAFVLRPPSRPRSSSAQRILFFPNDAPAASSTHAPVSRRPNGDLRTHCPRETLGHGGQRQPRCTRHAPVMAETPPVLTEPISTPPQGQPRCPGSNGEQGRAVCVPNTGEGVCGGPRASSPGS